MKDDDNKYGKFTSDKNFGWKLESWTEESFKNNWSDMLSSFHAGASDKQNDRRGDIISVVGNVIKAKF